MQDRFGQQPAHAPRQRKAGKMIEVLRCADCTKLAICLDGTRLTTESRKEKGHGSGKCAGQWTVVVAAEMPVSAKAAEAPRGQEPFYNAETGQVEDEAGYKAWLGSKDMVSQKQLLAFMESRGWDGAISILKRDFFVAAPAAPSEPVTPSLSEERERFERWARKESKLNLAKNGDRYRASSTRIAWMTWCGRAGLSSQEGR